MNAIDNVIFILMFMSIQIDLEFRSRPRDALQKFSKIIFKAAVVFFCGNDTV